MRVLKKPFEEMGEFSKIRELLQKKKSISLNGCVDSQKMHMEHVSVRHHVLFRHGDAVEQGGGEKDKIPCVNGKVLQLDVIDTVALLNEGEFRLVVPVGEHRGHTGGEGGGILLDGKDRFAVAAGLFLFRRRGKWTHGDPS